MTFIKLSDCEYIVIKRFPCYSNLEEVPQQQASFLSMTAVQSFEVYPYSMTLLFPGAVHPRVSQGLLSGILSKSGILSEVWDLGYRNGSCEPQGSDCLG